MKVILILAMCFFSVQLYANSLNHNCEPQGLKAKGREIWDAKSFWQKEIVEIQEYVKNAKMTYQLSKLEAKRDRINEQLDDK